MTAGCAVVTPVESVPIGLVGALLANGAADLLVWLRVDDAVGATGVHGKEQDEKKKKSFRYSKRQSIYVENSAFVFRGKHLIV